MQKPNFCNKVKNNAQLVILLIFCYGIGTMKQAKATQLLASMKAAQKHISKLSPKQKSTLEKGWDIEHAYYSSALEGSKLDRKEFEELARTVS